jgi:DinB superfamily
MIESLILSVLDSRNRAIKAVQGLSPDQAAAKPAEDCWSVNEILEHLVLAEHSGLSKIWAAADGVRKGRPVWIGEHTNRGLPIDEIVARTWKPRELAPPIACPHIGGPINYWIEYFRSCHTVLERLGTSLQGLELEDVVFPHFLSGPLDAKQRLEFLRFHIDRHIAQIEGVKRSFGDSAA